MFDWNDARVFLSVAETGSTLAAGRALRVSQTTVARRITALEAALNLTLFDRRRDGYALTGDGVALLPEAQRIAAAVAGFADVASNARRVRGGTVRLTSEESFIVGLLPNLLRDLRDAHPEILIELDASEELRDLGGGAADIAIRVAKKMDGAGLVGRHIGDDLWTVYCSREYAETHGVPRNRHELRAHPLISGGGGVVGRYYGAWLRENGLEGAVAMTHPTVSGLLAAVRSGLGCAALPCLIAELDDALVRCLRVSPPDRREVWLLTHERLRHVPRIRTVMDFLGERLAIHARRVAERLQQPLA